MMTRKDYVETANILADSRESLLALGLEGEQIFENLVSDFIEMFQNDNDRFIVSKFADACWVETNGHHNNSNARIHSTNRLATHSGNRT